jgi:pimeloyl-ACP methyl ester carboxylesterase
MSQMTSRVTSADGTTIAYECQGSGPAVILVGGGLDDGAENAPLGPVLAEHFTVYNYARRGRGDSGDTPPYAVQREIEDLDALIAVAGGSAHLYGVSSGGALVLEAAATGTAVDRLAVYEVPYAVGDDLRTRFERYVEQTRQAYDEGRQDAILELFMRVTGASDEDVAAGKDSSYWAQSVTLAHTLVHDILFLNGYRLPADRLGEVTQPVLVVTGGRITEPHMAGLPADFFDRAADAIAATVPNAERRILEGQGHMVAPEAMTALLRTFFSQ